jgi:hypothetical protein
VKRTSPAARWRKEGLTLLEALLALTILALSGAIVYSFLATVLISWTSGVERGRKGQVAGIVVDRLGQQLRSAVPARIIESGRKRAAFRGDEDSLRFVTLLPTGLASLRQVSYAVEEGDEGPELVYREYPWPDKDFFEEKEPLKEERLPEIVDMEVVLRPRKAGEKEGWSEEEWSPEGEDLPGAAEVLLVVAGAGSKEGRSVKMAVPLRALPLR